MWQRNGCIVDSCGAGGCAECYRRCCSTDVERRCAGVENRCICCCCCERTTIKCETAGSGDIAVGAIYGEVGTNDTPSPDCKCIYYSRIREIKCSRDSSATGG